MEELLKPNGNYKKLLSYQKADVIFQITCFFCEQFLKKSDRTYDQMVQAARSGKQNIIEGCAASPTSSKTELKLLNVAKASLKELLADYEDFLNVRELRQWQPGDREFETMRILGRKRNDAEYFMNIVKTRPAETIANMAIVLLNQANFLLHKQLQRAGEDFVRYGGFTERLYRIRKNTRDGGGKY